VLKTTDPFHQNIGLSRVAEKVISSGALLIVTVIDLEQPFASVAVCIISASKLVVAVALKVIVPFPSWRA
jgi:hypothetical protein